MDEQNMESPRQENPRRKRRTQEQIIKENYLPLAILAVAAVLIIVFIAGSITRGMAYRQAEEDASIAASQEASEQKARLDAQAAELIKFADANMIGYNYQKILDAIDSFEGTFADYPDLENRYNAAKTALQNSVEWSDPNDVINLNFHNLIVNSSRAFGDNVYGTTYNRDYVTCDEFSRILAQLYENGYVLVSLSDIAELTENENGVMALKAKSIYLPGGKKPLIITQTNVNYYNHIVDSNNDYVPDKNGDGFAYKLIVDEFGEISAQMVDSDGQIVTGDYDLVPILESFIDEHPDFSYNGARATLAPSGYDGIFGYRIDADGKARMTAEEFEKECADARNLVNTLREKGYTLACYTYQIAAYGKLSASEIQSDLDKWKEEITPIIGDVDVLVYAKSSDITDAPEYSGEKYDVLKRFGFRYYIGFSSAGGSWMDVHEEYCRMGRIMVTGATMYHNGSWFTDQNLFNPVSVLEPGRGTVPKPV